MDRTRNKEINRSTRTAYFRQGTYGPEVKPILYLRKRRLVLLCSYAHGRRTSKYKIKHTAAVSLTLRI